MRHNSIGEAEMQPAIHAEPTSSADLGGPALRAFFALAERWKLRTAEQRTLLGEPPESTYFKWKKQQDGTPSRDVIERISYLLGIWKDLQILFPDPAQADAWVRRPNDAPLFAGRSALDRMLSGNVADLYVVRQYLDAQRGWNG
ncbi:Protein of unknown function [Luteibacter sp. 329MFSha]|nr:Protein of unknown function [Luteibacter sp. 329MFSha]